MEKQASRCCNAVCAGYKGHPFNKSLFDHDDYAFQAPLLRTVALCSQHRCGPMKIASTESLHINTYEPLETRKNQNELPLREDALMFLLHNEHIFTSSNFTLVAHPSATSEGLLYRSDGGFSRTDVPSSQYTGL